MKWHNQNIAILLEDADPNFSLKAFKINHNLPPWIKITCNTLFLKELNNFATILTILSPYQYYLFMYRFNKLEIFIEIEDYFDN